MQLKERGFINFDALDANSNMLEKAKRKNIYGKHVLCVLGGDNRIPLEDGQYKTNTH